MPISRHKPMSAAQRARHRVRRHRTELPGAGGGDPGAEETSALAISEPGHGASWDSDASPPQRPGTSIARRNTYAAPASASLGAQILGLLSDPAVQFVTPHSIQQALGHPMTDISVALSALVAAGELHEVPDAFERFAVHPERKRELEMMFHAAAEDMGAGHALVPTGPDELAFDEFEEFDEPRLPVTAGLLSMFLPGTGQLLNGDVARASLVFAVWSLAILAGLFPIWIFVALYSGAEAFFRAKIRSMERQLYREQQALQAAPGGLPDSNPERA